MSTVNIENTLIGSSMWINPINRCSMVVYRWKIFRRVVCCKSPKHHVFFYPIFFKPWWSHFPFQVSSDLRDVVHRLRKIFLAAESGKSRIFDLRILPEASTLVQILREIREGKNGRSPLFSQVIPEFPRKILVRLFGFTWRANESVFTTESPVIGLDYILMYGYPIIKLEQRKSLTILNWTESTGFAEKNS